MAAWLRATLLGLLVAAVWAPVFASAPDETPSLLGPGLICHGEPPPTIVGPHRLVMLRGMGDDHMVADTQSAEAQRWFDYGLTLARSFEHADAIAAFQRAEAADPNCSLCVWGEAWARGPTINYVITPDQTAAALALALKARSLAAPTIPAPMKGLESALVDRYQATGPAAGDHAFASDLETLHQADPRNVELAVFDADAWLIQQNDDGQTASAMHAVEVLKPLVPSNLNSSGLLHFYIHATENAGVPELAAPYAARVAELAPNASHMVHMPSHTFFDVGRYEDAALFNIAALKADRVYAEATDSPTPLGRLMYHFHDIMYGLDAAMMSGDGRTALRFVQAFNQDFPSPAAYDPQHAEMAAGVTYAVFGRFADPATVLAAPDTVAAKPYLEAMRHYARGQAYLRLGRRADASAEAAMVTLPASGAEYAPASRNAAVVQIARLTLLGDAALLAHDRTLAPTAATLFQAAAALQETRLAGATDPPRWWYPVRRSLAAALLAEDDPADAEREANTVLAHWKLDPVTLLVRAKAERARHEPGAAADLAVARRAWRGTRTDLEAAANS